MLFGNVKGRRTESSLVWPAQSSPAGQATLIKGQKQRQLCQKPFPSIGQPWGSNTWAAAGCGHEYDCLDRVPGWFWMDRNVRNLTRQAACGRRNRIPVTSWQSYVGDRVAPQLQVDAFSHALGLKGEPGPERRTAAEEEEEEGWVGRARSWVEPTVWCSQGCIGCRRLCLIGVCRALSLHLTCIHMRSLTTLRNPGPGHCSLRPSPRAQDIRDVVSQLSSLFFSVQPCPRLLCPSSEGRFC